MTKIKCIVVALILVTINFSTFSAEKRKSKNKTSIVSAKAKELGFDISTMPNFCGHEHWGCVESNGGYVPELDGFRADLYAGASPQKPTSIWDVLLDPYLMGWLYNEGRNPYAMAFKAGYKTPSEWWNANPQAALDGFKELATTSIMTGTFQCTARGIEFLYGVKLQDFKLKDWQKADSLIRISYADMFTWYETAMKKAHFTELIRPVHPEFYLQQQSPETAKQELSFTHTILRIDPFMDMWKVESKRRDNLAKVAGVEPTNAQTWREFITFYLNLAAKNHTTGIKSLQAYRRNLDFKIRKDEDVKFRGDLTPDEIVVFQDWIMNECCRQANERKWAHQMHVGTHNLKSSSPLPLEALGERYPNMNIVMLHCWPFFKEAAYLAKNKPNFYIDNCWMPILSPAFFSEALDTYLNYVPYQKIMLSHDATTIEMAVGSSLFTREILEEKLLKQKSMLKLSQAQLREAALDMLQNNAVSLYGIGEIAK
ncbi:MAG: amidohydrolase family protein [Paludibacter sp.]|jgi:hypothetical protein